MGYNKCDNLHFLEDKRSKNPNEELPEVLQSIPIPPNADLAMEALLAALNQTNTLIMQKSKRIGVREKH